MAAAHKIVDQFGNEITLDENSNAVYSDELVTLERTLVRRGATNRSAITIVGNVGQQLYKSYIENGLNSGDFYYLESNSQDVTRDDYDARRFGAHHEEGFKTPIETGFNNNQFSVETTANATTENRAESHNENHANNFDAAEQIAIANSIQPTPQPTEQTSDQNSEQPSVQISEKKSSKKTN